MTHTVGVPVLVQKEMSPFRRARESPAAAAASARPIFSEGSLFASR